MKNLYYYLLASLFVLTLFSEPLKADVYSNVQKLRKKLLKDYEKNISPHGGSNGSTIVKYSTVVKEVSVVEDHQTFMFEGFLVMHWTDNRLKWNSKEFSGEGKIDFENDELWKPDLMIMNSADGTDIDHFGNSKLSVYDDGSVLWAPPVTLSVPCTLDLKYWPYDTHKCIIYLLSGTHDGFQINIRLFDNETKISLFKFWRTKHPWTILEAEQVRNAYKFGHEIREYFRDMELRFTIKRNSPTFGAFVIVPAVAIPLLLMVQFILPVDHPNRLLIGFASSLLVMMELLFLKFSLPKLGPSVPLIVSFYSETFMIVILTILISSILGRLTHPTNPLLDIPPPEYVKIICKGRLATFLRVETDVGMSGKTSEDVEALASTYPNYSHEWLLVAKVVDRISFILVLCVFILSLLCYVAPIH